MLKTLLFYSLFNSETAIQKFSNFKFFKLHVNMTAVTIQSNKIVLNQVKDNQALLESSYRKKNEFFGQPNTWNYKYFVLSHQLLVIIIYRAISSEYLKLSIWGQEVNLDLKMLVKDMLYPLPFIHEEADRQYTSLGG